MFAVVRAAAGMPAYIHYKQSVQRHPLLQDPAFSLVADPGLSVTVRLKSAHSERSPRCPHLLLAPVSIQSKCVLGTC